MLSKNIYTLNKQRMYIHWMNNEEWGTTGLKLANKLADFALVRRKHVTSELKKESIKKPQICVNTLTIATVSEALNDTVMNFFLWLLSQTNAINAFFLHNPLHYLQKDHSSSSSFFENIVSFHYKMAFLWSNTLILYFSLITPCMYN